MNDDGRPFRPMRFHDSWPKGLNLLRSVAMGKRRPPLLKWFSFKGKPFRPKGTKAATGPEEPLAPHAESRFHQIRTRKICTQASSGRWTNLRPPSRKFGRCRCSDGRTCGNQAWHLEAPSESKGGLQALFKVTVKGQMHACLESLDLTL